MKMSKLLGAKKRKNPAHHGRNKPVARGQRQETRAKKRLKERVLGVIQRQVKLRELKVLARRGVIGTVVVVLFISSLFVRAEPNPLLVHEVIYPQSCRGTWQGMNNIFTQELDARAEADDFNKTNSAMPALGEPTVAAVPGKEEYNAFTVSLPILDQQSNVDTLMDQPSDTDQDLQLIIPPIIPSQEESPVENAPSQNTPIEDNDNNSENKSLENAPSEQVLGEEDKADDSSQPVTDEQLSTEKSNEEQEQPLSPPSQPQPQEPLDTQLFPEPETKPLAPPDDTLPMPTEPPATEPSGAEPSSTDQPIINFNNLLDKLINKALAEEDAILNTDTNASTADTNGAETKVDSNSEADGFSVEDIVKSVAEKIGDIVSDSADKVSEIIAPITAEPVDIQNLTPGTPSLETKPEAEDSPSLLGTLFDAVGQAISAITDLISPLPPSVLEAPSFAIQDSNILKTENGTMACADFTPPATTQIEQASLGLSYTLKDQSPLPNEQSGFLWAEYTQDRQNWMILSSIEDTNSSVESAYHLFNFPPDFDAGRISETIVRLRWFGKYDEPEIFIDSLWLDVARLGDSEQEKPSELKTAKKDFAAFEDPVFNLSFDPQVPLSAKRGVIFDNSQSQSIIEKYKERYKQWLESWANFIIQKPLSFARNALAQSPSADQATPNDAALWHETNLDISARLLTKDYGPTDIVPELLRLNSGQFKISLAARAFRPGAYILQTTIQKGESVQTLEQDFTWGVLVVNTDQSVYKTGDEASFFFGVLNDKGETACDATLEAKITDPAGQAVTLATADGTIKSSSSCAKNSVTDTPDYGATYHTTTAGTYALAVTATTVEGSHTITDTFSAQDDLPYRVRRRGASRIYPLAKYEMSIEVTARNDFKGTVTERVPLDFIVTPSSNFVITAVEDAQALTWDVALQAGESQNFTYEYNAPDISPAIFHLGEFSLTASGADQPIFIEPNQWEIASDGLDPVIIHAPEVALRPEVRGKAERLAREVPLPENVPHHTRSMEGNFESRKMNRPVSLALAREQVPPNAKISVVDAYGKEITDGIVVNTEEDTMTVDINPDAKGMRPGKYTLYVTDPDTEEVLAEQDYTWGVLAFNPDYAVYPPNTTANLSFGVLDDAGRVLCDAALVAIIADPSGNETVLGTGDGSIRVNEECYQMEDTQKPDYEANFDTTIPGIYQMTIIAKSKNGERTLNDSFSVDPNAAFYLKRTGPTRTYHPATYNYSLDFTAKEAGTYDITEKVPASFTITGDGFTVTEQDQTKILHWQVTAVAGETKTLAYRFKGPPLSPYLFLLGAAEVKTSSPNQTWVEPREWMLASDNACSSDVDPSGNWNTAGSWTSCGGVVPTTTDTVAIVDGDTITIDSAPNSVISVNINLGGTLNGGSATLNINNTAASGTSFTNSGTWTSSTGTVNFGSDVALTMLSGSFIGSNNFNNITHTFTPTAARTYTVGAAVEIGGNWTSTPGSTSNARDLTINLSGATTVTGTLTLDGRGCNNGAADGTASTTQFSTNGQNLTVRAIVVDGITNGDGCRFTTANSSVVTFTGTGTTTLFTLGQTGSTALMTTGTTTEWDVTSVSGTPTLFSTSGTTITVHILKIAASATIVNLGAAFTIDANSGNKLWINSGILNQENRTITAGASATLQIDSGGTLCLGGTTASTTANCASGATQATAQAMPSFTTYTFDAASTVSYLSNANVVFSSTPNYGNLTLNPVLISTNRTYTPGGAMTINGDFTINPNESFTDTPSLTVDPLNNYTVASGKTTTITKTNAATSVLILPLAVSQYLSTGKLVIASGGTLNGAISSATIIIKDTGAAFTNSGTYTYGLTKVSYTNTTSSTVLGMTGTSGTNGYYDLDINGTGGTHTLGANTTANNATTITAGTLNTSAASSFTLTTSTLSITGGLTANASFINITGAGAAFTKSGTFTYGTSTVEYTNATGATVLSMNNVGSTNAYYTIWVANGSHTLGGDIRVYGDLASVSGTLSDATDSVTVVGSVTCFAAFACGTITFTGGTFTQIVAANQTFGTNASDSTIDWTFNNLTFDSSSGSNTITLGNIGLTGTGQIIVNGTLTIGTGGTMTTLQADTYDRIIDANIVTITSKGILFASSSALFTVAGAFTHTSGGTFTHSNGIVTFDGTAALNFVNNTTTFYDVVVATGVTRTITAGASNVLTIANTLTINGTGRMVSFSSEQLYLTKNGETPLIVGGATAVNGLTLVVYRPAGTATNVAATTYNYLYILPTAATTLTLLGATTVNVNLLVTGPGAGIVATLDTNGQTLNVVGAVVAGFGTPGAVIIGASTVDVDGDVLIWDVSGSYISMTSGSLNVGGNWSNGANSVFTAGTGTVTFDAADAGNTIATGGTDSNHDFYDVIFDNSAGSWIFQTNDVLISNNLTVTNTSATGVNASVNVTVNGSVTGAGVINITNSVTFTQKVAAVSKTFGTTSGANDWTFYNLAFENSSGPRTIDTNGGSGQIIVSNTLTIGNADDSTVTTLDNNTTNDRIIDANIVTITSKGSLTASSSALFTIAGDFTNNGTFTHSSGTVTFDGASANINIPDAGITFYKVIIDISSPNAKTLVNGATIAVMTVANTLTVNGTGALTSGGGNEQVKLTKDGDTGGVPLTVGGATAVSGVAAFIYAPAGAATTVTGTTYSSLTINPTAATTLTLGEAVITSGALYVFGPNSTTAATLNTNNYDLTVGGALFVGAWYLGYADGVVNLGSSTVTVSGDVWIMQDTGSELDAGSSTLTVGGNWVWFSAFSSGGIFTAGTSTVKFNAGDAGNTIDAGAGAFNNVIFDNAAGSWTFQTTAATISGDLTMTAATQVNASVNVTVNGNVSCGVTCGTINITNAVTFTQSVDAAKNFGTSVVDDATVWTFSSLTFTATTDTITTSSNGTGNINVTGTLTISGSTTLDAGDRNWVLSGAGTPFARTGTFTGNTSTFNYTSTTGVDALSSAAMTGSNAYYNLTINSSGDTFTAGVAVAATNKVLVTAGILAMGANALTAGSTGVTDSGQISVASGHSLTSSGTVTIVSSAASTASCLGGTTLPGCTGAVGTLTLSTLVIGDGATTMTTAFGGTTPSMAISTLLNITTNATFTAGTGSTITLSAAGTPITRDGNFRCGTSTVAYTSSTGVDALSSAAMTGDCTTGNAFYNLVINGTNNFPVTNDIIVTNNLTVTAGSLTGTSNVTANSNVACGVTCGSITLTGGTFLQSVGDAKNFGTNVDEDDTWTFNNLTFTATTDTITTSSNGTGNINVTGDLTISGSTTLDAGDRTFVLSGSSGSPFVKTGTFTYNTSTIKYTGTTVTVLSMTGTGGSDGYYNLTVDGTGPFNAGGAIVANNDVTVTSGTLAMGANALTVNGGDISVSGIFSQTAGSATTVVTTGSIGGAGTTTFGELNIGTGSSDQTTTAGGDFTVSGVLTTVSSSSTNNFDASSKTITLSGTGTPFVNNETFTYGTSTIKYTGSDTTTVLAMTGTGGTNGYYKLITQGTGPFNAGGSITANNNINITSGTFAVGGNTLIGANITVDGGSLSATTSGGKIKISGGGDLSVTSGSIVTADVATPVEITSSDTATPTYVGVSVTGASSTINIPELDIDYLKSTGFVVGASVTVTAMDKVRWGGSGGTWNGQAAVGEVLLDATSLTKTLDGHVFPNTWASQGGSDCNVRANTDGTVTMTNFSGTYSGEDYDCDNGGTVTWVSGLSIAGTVYTDEGSTRMTTGPTVRVKVDGAGDFSDVADTTNCPGSSPCGEYLITGVTPTDSGAVLTIYLDDETENATTVTISSGLDLTGIDLYQNRVIVRYETGSSITNTNLDQYDWVNEGDANIDGDIGFQVTAGALTVSKDRELHIWTGKTFTPGGSVTTNTGGSGVGGDVHIVGIFTATTTESHSVGGSWTDTGTFNPASSTVTFAATSGTKTITSTGSSFYNLIINGSGGEFQPQDAMVVTNDLTITAGTLSGTQNVTVNGHAVGTAGIISLTGGTFEQRVIANKNFGPTTASTSWTFSTLIFSNSNAGATEIMIFTEPCSTCGVTVSSILYIGKSGDAVDATTTLNAEDKIWTLSGTGGDPFQILASPAGDLAPAAATFVYTGNNEAGNTTVQSETYIGLEFNNGSEIYALEGETSGSTTVTITAGTLNLNGQTLTSNGNLIVNGTLSGATDVMVNGNVTGSGIVTLTGGTFEQVVFTDKTFGSSSGTNTWTFSGLKFNNSSGAAGRTITPNAGTGDVVVSGTLTLGDSGTQIITFNNDTNDRVFDLNGAILISTQGSFTASNSVAFSVASNFTNNGAFAHSSGTVTFDTTGISILAGTGSPAITFFNFTSTTAGKTINFTAGQTFRINGKLTILGADLNPVNLHSTSSPTLWTINHQGTESVQYADIDDSACDGSSNISLDSTSTGTNDGTCWLFPSLSFTISPTSVSLNLTSPTFTTTATNTLTVTARAEFGYTLTAYETGVLTHTAYPSKTIDDWTGIHPTGSAWSSTCIAASECGFGYNTSDADIGMSTNYSAFAGLLDAPGDAVASSSGPVTGEATTITYRSSVSAIQAAGPYQTTIIYIVTPQF